MIRFSELVKRIFYSKFNEELQADTWAFCALSFIGANDDAQAICALHPEKRWMFRMAVGCSMYAALKVRIRSVIP
jgi:hypothetical protein